VSQHKSHVFSGVWLEDFFPLGILQVRFHELHFLLSWAILSVLVRSRFTVKMLDLLPTSSSSYLPAP